MQATDRPRGHIRIFRTIFADILRKPGLRSIIIPINWRSHSAKPAVSLT